ncbi:MAG: SBBP repeat-containing protein [Bacteroidia bacterium]|nr:SBBP repeat-containing protein [Bacteroidia bacterium]MDW8347963.1 SBBP repeat-containing protein [Bacteroidia bacterium]
MFFIFGCLIYVLWTWAQNENAQNVLAKTDRLFFIENKGQWHSDVLYLCRMRGLDAWITKYGVNYTFYKIERSKNDDFSRMLKNEFEQDYQNDIMYGHRVLFELENCNHNPWYEGKMQLEGYHNYFIGNEPTKYASYVGLYKEVWIKNVYNGIDIRYYFDNGRLRYDFWVQPYANPSQIKFSLRGQNEVYIKNDSQLCFTTRFGEVYLADLHTYQDRYTVQSKFTKNSDSWYIALGEYDKSKVLVIDPLIYSTYIGGGGNDFGYDIAVDAFGNAHITGNTLSSNYDTTPGAFQITNGGGSDVLVTKINSTGTGLIFSTYIGGSGADTGRSISIDAAGNIYITGLTTSANYDFTPGALQTVNAGAADAFVTKLDVTGSTLLYSTYLGGSTNDYGYGIAVDASGNAYITGYTQSGDYYTTTGAFQTTNGGINDIFVTKLNSTGTGIIYSTYIGGSGIDEAYGIALDGLDNAYITGRTLSTNYDVTTGAFQTSNGGGTDTYITALNATGTSLIYSTYLGGSGIEWGYAIAVDAGGNAYVTGYTSSADYDVTTGAFQSTSAGGDDIFVTKINSTGTGLIYSTYIGGSSDDRGLGLAVDGTGGVYITGRTNSSDYDVTASAFQPVFSGGAATDVFVTRLSPSGTVLLYSTYIGGGSSEAGNSIAIDGNGSAYITGQSQSTDYDITAGVFQTNNEGSNDIIISKICTNTITLTSSSGPDNQIVCLGTAITNITYFTVASSVTVTGLPAGVTHSYSGDTVTISGTPTVAGTFNYTITLSGCGSITAAGTIKVNNLPTVNYTVPGSQDTVCTTDAPFVLTGGTPSGGTYSGGAYVTGGGTFNPNLASVGPNMVIYTYVDADGCINKDTAYIVVETCTDIQNVNAQNSCCIGNLYPNPAQKQTQMMLHIPNLKHVVIRLANTEGRIVSNVFDGNMIGSNVVNIPTANLPAGVYVCHVQIDNQSFTRYLMVSKSDLD